MNGNKSFYDSSADPKVSTDGSILSDPVSNTTTGASSHYLSTKEVNDDAAISIKEVVDDAAHRIYEKQISALSDKDPGSIIHHRKQRSSFTTKQNGLSAIPPSDENTAVSDNDYDDEAFDDAKTSITFGGQTELPPLPIPSLEETLDKFLKCLQALQDYEEQKETARKVVEKFLEKDGPMLQQLLLEYDQLGRKKGEIGSYVEEFWNDAYLAPDSSVVLNLNPYFLLESSPDPKLAGNQIFRAASLCFASVKLASQLRKEKFKPDTFRGKPLCMDQFRALFGASRVPKRNCKDTISVYDKSNHVAVMCCNQLYYFQALWPDGDVAVDEGDLNDILGAIRTHAYKGGREDDPNFDGTILDEDDYKYFSSLSAVGVLTSLSRNEWATVREEMMAHSPTKNGEGLTIVDSALFVLVLDDYIPPNKHAAAANILHGSYELAQRKTKKKVSSTGDKAAHSSFILPCEQYQIGSCTNRWYDKLQIIVTKDGNAGINFEHSAIDGHTALRFVSDIYADTIISFAQSITKLVQAHEGFVPNVINAKIKRAAVTLDDQGRTRLDVFPKKINFDLPDAVMRKIYYAETALGDEIVASDTYFLEFMDYGKIFVTGNKLSPDSYVQMSMMLAYYKLYGRVVCAYEPVLTKAFYHGRTEAMRPATLEAKHLCEVFCNPKSPPDEKLSALRNAVRVHSVLVKECSKGKGVDRHLYALKCIAEKNGLPVPDFFSSEPWKMLNHTVLSTSNCGNPSLALFGFGPVVPDGLGIGYIIKDTCLHYAICSKHRQTTRYAMTLEAVLREMAQLLEPLSHTKVRDAPRMSLRHIPVNAISYDAYGDIWGESTPTRAPRSMRDLIDTSVLPADLPALESPPTQLVRNAIEAPCTENDPGTPKERRWSAEEITPLNEEGCFDDEKDGSSPQASEGCIDFNIDLNDLPKSPLKMKRRGSNDKLPTKPNRRGSMGNRSSSSLGKKNRVQMVGPAKRQTSFDYSELSKKGDSIVFENTTLDD